MNVGLAVASGGGRRTRMMDLLPERHRPWRITVWFVAVAIGLVLCAAGAFQATTHVDTVEEYVAALAHEVEKLEQEERRHRLVRAGGEVARASIEESLQASGVLESHAASLNREVQELLTRAAVATRDSVPGGVQINEFSLREGEMSLSGTAPSHAEVFSYAANLKRSGLFPGVSVKRLETSGLAAGPDRPAVGVKVQFWITALP